MGSVVEDAWDTYRSNLRLVLFFSIPFIIALLIPLLAPLPTYISAGGIFLRSASIFLNLGYVSLTVIVVSVFLSLLFISFSFVAISLIVKAKRTRVKNPSRVIQGIERYTAKVFLLLLIYEFVLIVANIWGYYYNLQRVVTPLVGFIGFMLIFYAPSAMVVDDKRMLRSVRDSLRLVIREPQYFFLWLFLLFVVLSAVDLVVITIAGTLLSTYIVLIIASLFILPYFVILQAEAYMKRFPLLKH